MTHNFNLIRDKWLPVVLTNGERDEVGILDAITMSSRYREIYDESPLVTASLLRLLLAIVYRCAPPVGQPFEKWWEMTWQQEMFNREAVYRYLIPFEASGAFNLFDETNPFYQVGKMSMQKTASASRLIIEAASGNNAAVFDHTLDDVPEALTPAKVARHLVATHSFGVGIGVAASATLPEGDMEETLARPHLSSGIIVGGVTTWLGGGSLFQTLMLNLSPLDSSSHDKPAWELEYYHELKDKVKTGRSTIGANKRTKSDNRDSFACRGTLDRYTWQSRMIRLLPESDGDDTVVRRVYFTQGRDADQTSLDPMMVYSRSDESSPYIPIKLTAAKASWRDAHSLMAFDTPTSKRPEAFNHVATMVSRGIVPPQARFNLHVTGIATGKKAGKLVLWRHDELSLPALLLNNPAALADLEACLKASERLSNSILWSSEVGKANKWKGGGRVFSVCKDYLYPDSSSETADEADKKADEDKVARLARSIDPCPQYWSHLQTHFPDLISGLGSNAPNAKDQWLAKAEIEARDAYQTAIKLLGRSARALRAIARQPDRFYVRRRRESDDDQDNSQA